MQELISYETQIFSGDYPRSIERQIKVEKMGSKYGTLTPVNPKINKL
jgi:hypothetical protein